MSLFMTLGWERFGGSGLLLIALGYGMLGLTLAARFERQELAVPSALCAAFAVAMTPLAIYGLQVSMGWWPDDTVYRDYHRLVRMSHSGSASVWGGLSAQEATTELARLCYAATNVGLIFTGVLLARRVCTVFGVIGLTWYLGYLGWQLFADSLLFPFVLAAIGFGIIWLGILWQRHEEELTERLLLSLGFEERTRGSHHLFSRSDIPELINLQGEGGDAKPYQVRQIRRIILRYGLHEAADE